MSELIDTEQDINLIESAYKKEYNEDFAKDVFLLNDDIMISRLLNIDTETRFGSILTDRMADINNFKHIKDFKQRSDAKKIAKKHRTDFRKKIIKIKANKPIKRDLNISQYYD